MKPSIIVTIAVAILLVGFLGAHLTGYVTLFETEDKIIVSDSSLEFPLEDLKECCIFINEKGVEKRCVVTEAYGCEYCAPYCG